MEEFQSLVRKAYQDGKKYPEAVEAIRAAARGEEVIAPLKDREESKVDTKKTLENDRDDFDR